MTFNTGTKKPTKNTVKGMPTVQVVHHAVLEIQLRVKKTTNISTSQSSCPQSLLFPYAEVSEYDIQDLLRTHPSCDPAQAGEGQADPFGGQGQVLVPVVVVLGQRQPTLLEVGPVAGLGQTRGTGKRVTTPVGKEVTF